MNQTEPVISTDNNYKESEDHFFVYRMKLVDTDEKWQIFNAIPIEPIGVIYRSAETRGKLSQGQQ